MKKQPPKHTTADGRKPTSWKLDDTLVTLHALTEEIPITIGQVCEGIMVFGISGSGKTSGSLNTINRAMLEKGFGIYNACIKKDEAQRARKLAALTGRGKDVRVMRLGGDVKFNFLESLKEGGADAITAAFKQINQSLLGQMKETEWTQASQEHLNNLVRLFLLAGRKMEISELRLAADNFKEQKKLLEEAEQRVVEGTSEQHSLKMLSAYFWQQWKTMGEKTRASVIMSLTPTMNPFCDGPMRDLFCTETNFHPRELRQGRILIADIPCVGELAVYGIAAQTIMKYMVQQMIESDFGNGLDSADDSTRPVVIVVDECQYITTGKDAEFVTTSRSCKGSLLYLTQDVNNFYRRGGETIKAETGTLLSNLHGVRIMHQNSCKDTYEWFMGILGKEWQAIYNQSANFSGPVGGGSAGASISMHHENQITQRDFLVGLARGGKPYSFVVSGILQQDGRVFKGGKMFTQVAFPQLDMSNKKKRGLFARLFRKKSDNL